jgi:hypothetical protein
MRTKKEKDEALNNLKVMSIRKPFSPSYYYNKYWDYDYKKGVINTLVDGKSLSSFFSFKAIRELFKAYKETEYEHSFEVYMQQNKLVERDLVLKHKILTVLLCLFLACFLYLFNFFLDSLVIIIKGNPQLLFTLSTMTASFISLFILIMFYTLVAQENYITRQKKHLNHYKFIKLCFKEPEVLWPFHEIPWLDDNKKNTE